MSHKNQKIQKILDNKEAQKHTFKENKRKVQDQKPLNQPEIKVVKQKIEPKLKPKSKMDLKFESRMADNDCLSAFIMTPSEGPP